MIHVATYKLQIADESGSPAELDIGALERQIAEAFRKLGFQDVWMAEELSRRGPRQVVITGLVDGDFIENFVYERERGTEVFRMPKIDGERSGTGDAFAAIVAGSLLHGETLSQAVQKAAVFISKVIRYAVKLDLPWNYGLPFEEYLTQLR